MTRPLTGVRVLDLTLVLAGPYAGRMLGDLGADVIKVEQPGSGDPSRQFGPYFLNGESAYYLGFNCNKRGITLNLQNPKGREVFYKLVQRSDVVLENFRPSVPPRLGIDYDTLKKINDKLIYCSISGFGHGVVNQDSPAMDTTIQALSGVMSIIGEPGRPPCHMGFAVGDLAGSYSAVAGIMAALFDRERTGQGRWVDISLLDTMISLQGYIGQFYLVSGDEPGPLGSQHPTNVPVGAFRAKDGVYLQLHCTTQRLYEMLAEAIASNVEEFRDLPKDPRFATPGDRRKNRGELYKILEQAIATKTSEEWLARTSDAIAIARVNTIQQSLQEPSILKRNMVVETTHPVAGRFKILGTPFKLGQEEVFNPAPTLGQHNDEVLQELGYSREEIEALRQEGAI